MTDPLGQSQVIPYVQGLSMAGYNMTILSCEKKQKFAETGTHIKKILEDSGIDWHYIFFTSSPPIAAKVYDLFKFKRKALSLYRKNKFSLTHCRSYVSADIGLLLKKKYGVKFLFDMRGFWVDERVEGGIWNIKNPLFKYIYKSYKHKEAAFISNADYIVSLTQNGKKEIEKWSSYTGAPIKVIPCSADYELFSLTTSVDKQKARNELGIPQGVMVISYLGSIGTWYMLDEMLQFFKQLKEKYNNAVFLFITNGEQDKIKNKANAFGIDASDLIVKSASRTQVPIYSKAADFSLSFIKPVYSKISSSPTKLGELLAMGIPVICNSGIGDVKEIVEETGGGIVFDNFTQKDFEKVIDKIELLKSCNPLHIRETAKKYYWLEQAREWYVGIYKKLLS